MKACGSMGAVFFRAAVNPIVAKCWLGPVRQGGCSSGRMQIRELFEKEMFHAIYPPEECRLYARCYGFCSSRNSLHAGSPFRCGARDLRTVGPAIYAARSGPERASGQEW